MKSIISKALGLLTLTCMLNVMPSANGATVGYWDFEQGVPGSQMSTQAVAVGAVEGLANDYALYVEGSSSSPVFSEPGNGALGYGIAGVFTPNQFLYTSDAALDNFSTDTWTVEFTFNLSTVSGWITMIGRDYSSTSQSAMYIQKVNGGQLGLTFRTVSSELLYCNSDYDIAANTWYRVAIVANVNTVDIYVDTVDGNGYQSIGSWDLDTIDGSGGAVDHSCLAGPWSFGRGMYNSGRGDWITGMIGEVRISDAALSPSEFLHNGYEVAGPSPAYGEENVDINDDDLTWFCADPSLSAESYDIYFTTDPNVIDPNATSISPTYTSTEPYVDLPTLNYMEEYGWRVDTYVSGQAEPIVGPVMIFKTANADVQMVSSPADVLANPDAVFSCTTISATDYQWSKDGVEIADGGVYSGATTKTLTVTGATIAEEGIYTCRAYNDTSSAESEGAYLWTARLMGMWSFEGNLDDSVAAVVSGATVHNGEVGVNAIADPTGDGVIEYASGDEADGFVGDAAKFTGDSDFVAVDGDFFNFYPYGMTVNFWMKASELSGWHLPMSKLDAGTAGWLIGSDTSGGFAEKAIIETEGTQLEGPDVATDDLGWHMFTMTYDADADVLAMYIDGDQGDTLSIDLSTYSVPEAPLSIGGRNNENSVMAYIDEVEVYSYALTPTEIAVKYTDLVPEAYVCVEDPDNPLLYDITGDCRTNVEDFASFAIEWLQCQRYPVSSCDW